MSEFKYIIFMSIVTTFIVMFFLIYFGFNESAFALWFVRLHWFWQWLVSVASIVLVVLLGLFACLLMKPAKS